MEPGYYWATWAQSPGKPIVVQVAKIRTAQHSKVTYVCVRIPGSREPWVLAAFNFLQRIPNYEDPPNSSDPSCSSG